MLMTPIEFNQYLKETSVLSSLLPEDPDAKEKLFQLIDQEVKRSVEHPDFLCFFQGERAFYLGHYENALKHYLEAKSIPHFQFFCYRATACLQEMLGFRERAVAFAQKALKIYPEDPSLHRVLATQVQPPLKIVETVMKTETDIPSDSELSAIFVKPAMTITQMETPLERRIQAFQLGQAQMVRRYGDMYAKRIPPADHSLFVLQGWHRGQDNRSQECAPTMITEKSRKSSGGYFLRWNGKGLVINPGPHFLDTFHQKGLHIKDIDYVFITKDSPEAYADVKEIYELNTQLNKAGTELQIIHYYVNPKAYQELSHTLKPHFKQERNTLHRLELFVDSPDVEKVDLGHGIVVNYFPTVHLGAFLHGTEPKNDRHHATGSSLGLRVDLKFAPDKGVDKPVARLGYISGTAWSPMLSHHLGNCDVLITGIGSTNAADFNKVKYNEEGLGYFGTFSLLEEVAPKLLLCCEFSGREGDIRVEAVRKLRHENAGKQRHHKDPTVVLPGDPTLLVDLKAMQVRCSLTGELVSLSQVKVAKTTDDFGELRYLSPECCLV